MMLSIIYIILALLGLGLLVFVHEMGHFLAARWVGMRVDAFSIGFGRPIYHWWRNGVEWKIGWLPFGGYVRLGGMETEDGKDPTQIPDGFYGKRPIDRLKVVAAGPLVNLVFAFIFFAALWGFGGREKSFSAYTHTIGWVDEQSELYAYGIRPGDQISQYNDVRFRSFKDHLYAPMFNGETIRVQGLKVDAATGLKTPFDYYVDSYQHPDSLETGIKTLGILSSAQYLFYDKLEGGQDPIISGSPMADSGIQLGDRLYWVDGEIVFSHEHLSNILNDDRALVTVQRGDEIILRRVPRVAIGELKLDSEHRDELSDWQHAGDLKGTKLSKLLFLPHNLNDRGVVENTLTLIDGEKEKEVFPANPFSEKEQPLTVGDRIVAIDGQTVERSYDILKALQSRQVHIIVERESASRMPVTWTGADLDLVFGKDSKDLEAIVSTIGTDEVVKEAGKFVLLEPITPKKRIEFTTAPKKKELLRLELLKRRREVEKITDAEKRARALNALDDQENQVLLGVALQDRQVRYNPGPVQLFSDVCREIWSTLSALVKGYLNPKFVAGPIGIVQVMQTSWSVSLKEALFWLGAISLNLGFLNLLPVPVLDGGYICLSLFEMVTGRRVKPKMVERLIIPFAILIIALMLFLTFNDLSRIFGGLFR